MTGGRDLGEVSEAVFEHNLENEATTRPIWPFLLILATILLPIDVAVRRVVISARDWEKFRAATVGRFSRQEVAPSPRTEEMSGLFRAKQRARQDQKQDSGLAGRLRTLREDRPNEQRSQSAPRPIERPDAPEPQLKDEPKSGEEENKDAAGGSLASRLLKKKREQK